MSQNDNTKEKSVPKLSGLMKRASTLAEQGMYDEAIENVKEAMALCPQDPKYSIQLADFYKAQRRMGPAIEAMKQAMELDPLNNKVHEQLLKILLEMGSYDDAIRLSYRLIECSPKNVFARDVLGIAYLQQGKIDKALKVTDELIRIDPTDCCHYFKRAVLLQQKGMISSAMESFTQSLNMDPDGEMAEDAREAIAALDSYQLRQVITIAIDDAVFKAKLVIDAESALVERGFKLSSGGIATLKQLNLEEIASEPQSRYYH